MNKNITISKDDLLEVYKNGSADDKKLLERLYGKDLFRGNVMNRIKTFEDAVKELGNDHPLVKEYKQVSCLGFNTLAYLRLRIITAALNEGWKPQFTKNEERYYPCIFVYTQNGIDDLDDDKIDDTFLFDKPIGTYVGVKSVYSDDVAEVPYLYADSRLCFKSEELSDYAGKQFIDIYADYYLK